MCEICPEAKIAVLIQPVNGLSPKEIKEKRAKIRKWCKKKGLKMMSTSYFEFKDTSIYHLSKGIKTLCFADVVIMADGWEDSRSCKIEHIVAEEYKIPILYEKDLD